MDRVAHYRALDLIARRLDHSHWRPQRGLGERLAPLGRTVARHGRLSQDVASSKKKPDDPTPHFLSGPVEPLGTIGVTNSLHNALNRPVWDDSRMTSR